MLNGCVTTNSNVCLKGDDLPEMPLAGQKVALEIEQLCKNEQDCFNLNNWLNELYLFRQQYLIYRKN